MHIKRKCGGHWHNKVLKSPEPGAKRWAYEPMINYRAFHTAYGAAQVVVQHQTMSFV